MSTCFVGEVRPFAGNFAPRGWMLCNGQLLSISQYSALFSLLGTQYGGNGTTNFALPNLQGRLPVDQGTGQGLTPRTIGEMSGVEQVTLLQANLPVHTHTLNATTAAANSATIANNLLPAAPPASGAALYTLPGSPAPTPETLGGSACGIAGSSLPHNNLMPSLCLTFIIAVTGIFPTRN